MLQAHGLCVSLNSRLESNKEEEAEGFRTEGVLPRSIPISKAQTSQKAGGKLVNHYSANQSNQKDLVKMGLATCASFLCFTEP